MIQEEVEEPGTLGEVIGNRDKRRGSESLGVVAGDGCKKKPFSAIAFSSASESKFALAEAEELQEFMGDLLKGSGINGVTGLKTRAGKSSMLGESISGLGGENPELFWTKPGMRGLSLRFLRLFLLS